MIEQSGKRRPRLDEELRCKSEGLERGAHPTHAHVWAEDEPVETDVGRDSTSGHAGRAVGTPPGMSAGDVEDRSEIARVLAGSRFLATGRELTCSALVRPPVALARCRPLPPRMEADARLLEVL